MAESLSQEREQRSPREGKPPPPLALKSLHRDDIVCARGNGVKELPGNKRFRKIIKAYVRKYRHSVGKKQKSEVVTEILELCREAGGDFKRYNHLTQSWTRETEVFAREKIGFALRDELPARYSSSTGGKILVAHGQFPKKETQAAQQRAAVEFRPQQQREAVEFRPQQQMVYPGISSSSLPNSSAGTFSGTPTVPVMYKIVAIPVVPAPQQETVPLSLPTHLPYAVHTSPGLVRQPFFPSVSSSVHTNVPLFVPMHPSVTQQRQTVIYSPSHLRPNIYPNFQT